MKVVVILPTYNERGNILPLIDALIEQFASIDHDMAILVVDDNSPDGTGALVAEKARSTDNLYLITGEKAGLGAAYVRGMRYALDTLGADVIFEMDADFSHRPEDVPRLLDALERGADFVIGSRYVEGGGVRANWGLMRRMNSLFGNLVARYVAGLYRIMDCTAGFRAIRASLLRDIDFDNLRVQGYAFQVALLHEARLHDATIVEVPVEFVDRREGESKLGLRDIVEFIINAWWIRLRSHSTFIKFAVVGASGVIVNLGAFTALLGTGLSKYIASPIAIEISIISNFILNNYWTFRSRKTKDRVRIKGLKFNAISILALGVSYSTFLFLSWLFPGTPPQVHQLIGIVPASLVNYFLNSYWTFQHDPEKA